MGDYSVVMPVFGDQDNAKETAERIKNYDDGNLREFIIVVDGEKIDIEWDKATIIHNGKRVGKAKAISQALDVNSSPVVVLVSSDLYFKPSTLENLAAHISDNTDIAVPRVKTMKNGGGESGEIADTIWRLHHLVSSESVKGGEMIAFRPENSIPEDIVTDEEYISSQKDSKSYLKDEIVYNKPPASLKQLYIQRRRIFAGHLELQQRENYVTPTNRPIVLMKAVKNYLINGESASKLFKASIIESFARFEGAIWALAGRKPWKWKKVKTV